MYKFDNQNVFILVTKVILSKYRELDKTTLIYLF